MTPVLQARLQDAFRELARGSCFGFSSPKARSEEKPTKPPTTKSTATASVGVESLTEPASEGNEQLADSGEPARSCGSRLRAQGIVCHQPPEESVIEACRARFLDGSTSLEEALRVVRSGTEGDTVSVHPLTSPIWSEP